MGKTEERGRRFVTVMFAVLCVVAGLLALFGVSSAAPVSIGSAGMLLGLAAARYLIPRRDLGLTGKSVLMLLAIGGVIVGGPRYLSVFDFHSVGGMLALGLYFGFRVMAVPRLTEPMVPGPPGGRP